MTTKGAATRYFRSVYLLKMDVLLTLTYPLRLVWMKVWHGWSYQLKR